MSGSDTEEKKHAPSSKKLKNLREKEGQIPKSQDFAPAITLVCVLAYLMMDSRGLLLRFKSLFNAIYMNFGMDFTTQIKFAGPTIMNSLAAIILPAMGVATFATIASTFWNTKGLVINKKAVAPNFTKLNPVQGFKNLFKLQTLIDLLKGITKITLIAICMIFIAKSAISSLLIAPSCGVECVVSAGQKLFMQVIIVALAIIVLGAFLDLPLSDWLFKRDQKMTDTEVKREQKEEMGDPHIRSARKQRHRQLIEGGPVGINRANLLLLGDGVAIGIVYVRGETPAPITVAKGSGAKATEFINYCRTNNIAIYQDNALVAELIGRSPMGDFVPRAYFMQVAKALVEVGLV